MPTDSSWHADGMRVRACVLLVIFDDGCRASEIEGVPSKGKVEGKTRADGATDTLLIV